MTLTVPRWQICKSRADDFTKGFTSPPIPVVEIAESNGVDVIFADFGNHTATVAGFCDFGAAKLYVNKADQLERQRFTVAHEFGHWVLHRDFYLENPEKYPVFPRFQSVDHKNPFEQEANNFAACLLVPERLLKPVVKSPVSALASVFRVSKTMMEYRLKNVR